MKSHKHPHTAMSDIKCIDCKKPLKLNVVERKQSSQNLRCFTCHDKNTAVRRNRLPLPFRPVNGRQMRQIGAAPTYLRSAS